MTPSAEARDTYLEKTVSGTSTNTNYKPTTTTSTYDPTGRRVAITENTPINGGDPITRLRYFSFDADGHILTRRDGTLSGSTFSETANSRQHFTYVNGQQVAAYGEDGHLDAATQLTAFDSSDMGVEPTLVLEGDTLQSIAQRVYGNPSLWYVLAAANAVSDEDLVAGTTLKAPQVKTTANDASTFKPYDPNSITGPTTPSLPYISASSSHHGCNMLATVIRIFVAVVVTYVSMNPAAGAAVAGIGEAAAQTVEIEDGDRQGYDWGQVGVSALTAGFAASKAGQSFGAWAAESGVAGRFVQGAAMAAASDVAHYAVNKALGQDANFSLRGMVSDSLAAGISAGVLGPAPTVNGVPAGAVSAVAFSWTQVAKAAVTSVVRQGINYGVHQAIEGHASWNSGQVLGNVVTDVATTVAGTSFAAQRQREAEARQMNDAAWADGNPFNGGVPGGDSTPDVMTDAGLSAAVDRIWAANADQPMLASGYGHNVDPLHPPTTMSTDGPRLVVRSGDEDAVTAEDLKLYELQARIDDLRKQGADVSAFQSSLDAISRSSQIAKLDALFPGDPLDPNISDTDLAELRQTYAPALSHNRDPDIVTLAPIVVRPETNRGPLASASQWLPFDTQFYDHALGAWSTTAAAISDSSKIWTVQYKWNIPEGYVEHFVGSGGKPLKFLATPSLEANVVRATSWAASSATKVLTRLARGFGAASFTWEATHMNWSDRGDWGHLAFGTAVGAAGLFVTAPVSLTIGAAWGISDYFVQDYSYRGQTGWRALGNSASDYLLNGYDKQVQETQKMDPSYYLGPKY